MSGGKKELNSLRPSYNTYGVLYTTQAEVKFKGDYISAYDKINLMIQEEELWRLRYY